MKRQASRTGCTAALMLASALSWPTSSWSDDAGAPGDTSPVQPIRNVRYSYSIEPNSATDPAHEKLTDGVLTEPVMWSRHRVVDVDVDLGSTYHVTRVAVEAYRGASSRSRLRNVELFIENGSGYAAVGKRVNLAGADYFIRPYLQPRDQAEPGTPPLAWIDDTPLTIAFDGINRSGYRLRLRLADGYQTGWHFGVTEVRVYGTPAAEPVRTPAIPAPEHLQALAPYALPSTDAQLVFREGNFDGDPDVELLLANRFVTLVIEPALGGVIAAFTYRGVEFTQPKRPGAPGGGGGLLSDHVAAQPLDGDWFNGPYAYRIMEQGPERISLRLSGTGRNGPLAYLAFHKTITLRHDRSDVRVEYEIALDRKATAPLPFSFWFHNYVGTRGGTDSSDALAMYFPQEDGIQVLRWDREERSDRWYTRPARGWTAFADAERRMGLAFVLDYPYLRNFHSWGAKNSESLPTMAWRFNPVNIPDGGSFKTACRLMPFHDLGRVCGAADGMVGDLQYCPAQGTDAAQIVARVMSAAQRRARAVLRGRILPYGDWQVFRDEKVALEADTLLTLTADLKPAGAGTHVFSLLLEDGGRELLDLETPVSLGAPETAYVLRPKEKRHAVRDAPVSTRYVSMAYETPHVKWARPWHGGSIKALVLVDGRYQREVIELAQRIDLDVDSTYLFPTHVREAIADFYGRTTPADLERGLSRLLRDNPDWEVLVMAGHMFRYFSPEQRQKVHEKVQGGAGLVVVQPDATDPLPQLCPLQAAGMSPRPWAPWRKKQDHFITVGIPWEALPHQVDVYPYKPAAGAEVLASAGGAPLIAVRECGAGRVVALAYRSGDSYKTDKYPGDYFGLTPFMNRKKYGEFVSPPLFPYHEYHFSLLAKAIVWAARKEPTLRVDGIAANARTVALELHNAGPDRNATTACRMQDKYGNILFDRVGAPVQVSSGSNHIEIPVEVLPRDGLNLFDVVVRTEQGKVLAWASTALRVEHVAHIAEATADRAVYAPNDVLAMDVRLAGTLSDAMFLTARLRDGFGRLTAEQTLPVASTRQHFQFDLADPINRLLVAEAELHQGHHTLDTSRLHRPVELPLRASAHQGELALLGWNITTAYGLNNYLIEPFVQWLADVGFNAGVIMGTDNGTTCREAMWRHNMLLESRGRSIGRAKTGATGTPEYPERNPCISDPEWLKTGAETVRSAATGTGVYGIQAGDEASYGTGRRDTEVCFSPHCMAAMHRWLRTEYGSLDALNAQWGTAFPDWEQVRPLTLQETDAREDGNYSSWCDHRSFGEMAVAAAYRQFSQAAAQARPGARYGPSGNPQAGAYSGYDYWQLRNALSKLESYVGYDELALWARDETEIVKYGQFGDVDDLRYNIYYHLLFGTSGTAVCGTQRLPAFDWTDSRAGRGYREAWAPLRTGIGRLLNESTRTPDPIALHYSRNASRIAFALNHTGLWRDMRWKLRSLLDECGLDHGWVSYEQLEQGRLGDYRVIYLPMSCTLSRKEAATLERFVREGGVLVGEMATGIADGHGRMLPEGALDHMFGIKRQQSRIRMRRDVARRANTPFGLRFPELPIDYLESGLTEDSAVVLATAARNNQPIAFANPCGRGLAVYLACNLASAYEALHVARGDDTNAARAVETEQFIADLLGRAEVRRRLDVVDPGGMPVPFVKTVLFTQQDIRYFWILRGYPYAKDFSAAPVLATLRFPARGYVRELFSDTEYGLTADVETYVTPTSLQAYSWTPYRVEGIDLAPAGQTVAPGEAVRCTITLRAEAALSPHTLRLDVLDPGGVASTPYSRNLTVESGRATVVIPLALNDPRGAWQIRVKDLTSGVRASASFEVR